MATPRPLLVCVVGPTAIGKTALSVAIAQEFSTHILSADSRQFYKEMTIGTAVPSSEELLAAPHHFIQTKSIFDPYSVGDFEREALETLKQLFKEHAVVVLVGGSGLYIDAVVHGLDDFPEVPSEIRETLNTLYATKGIEPLQKELSRTDPVYFQKVDIHNAHRLIRALEVCRGTGRPYSSFLKKGTVARSFDVLYVGLTAERSLIYERINARVDAMVASGLVEEARALYAHRDVNALQTVGYRELFDYFEGTLDLEEAIEAIKKNSRRFAKRQLTWLRKNDAIHWFDFPVDPSEVIQLISIKKAR
ncbi:tRNA (adenosine(37)-N6)-dimethylallyltransferase MiaA [Altibacter sp.]|uniref:tRNA (adenosine(37)-N6)-dimethylallyltransferase MiaA n=1 Tax=Altibacter sp. TaxID=2024823 RepID=UPI000C94D8B1|nr:tRNA (adenosine(37)-N6)-dimethylallyltransferase MiaA [Altibacter sp.]MAP54370.1 tRNA (adenosine(37)-N6)-dimethylallyltransferase MiaA [Altibacter sp.]